MFLKNSSFSVFCLLVLSCTSCRSAKDRYADALLSFTEQVSVECEHYALVDWELVIEQYKAFRNERDVYRYELTAEENFLVDSCYRQLNALIAKGYIECKAQQVDGYIDEAMNLFQDLLE